MRMLGIICLAAVVGGDVVGPCDLVQEARGQTVKLDVTLVAFDPLFELMTLTHNPGNYLPLVARVDRVIQGSEPAKYILLNYCYLKESGQEWPQALRQGSVRFSAMLTRTPDCDSNLEDVLTGWGIDAATGTRVRREQLKYLLREDITAYKGMVPCYEFDSRSYSVYP